MSSTNGFRVCLARFFRIAGTWDRDDEGVEISFFKVNASKLGEVSRVVTFITSLRDKERLTTVYEFGVGSRQTIEDEDEDDRRRGSESTPSFYLSMRV
jgi:hypothetical protein